MLKPYRLNQLKFFILIAPNYIFNSCVCSCSGFFISGFCLINLLSCAWTRSLNDLLLLLVGCLFSEVVSCFVSALRLLLSFCSSCKPSFWVNSSVISIAFLLTIESHLMHYELLLFGNILKSYSLTTYVSQNHHAGFSFDVAVVFSSFSIRFLVNLWLVCFVCGLRFLSTRFLIMHH